MQCWRKLGRVKIAHKQVDCCALELSESGSVDQLVVEAHKTPQDVVSDHRGCNRTNEWRQDAPG